MSNYLPLIWLIILSITFFIYLINDGVAIGMGILIPFSDNPTKKQIFNLLLPSWDANQTWLVFTLAGLYGGFSLGFAKIMPLLYSPLILLMLALMLRGAAIECSMKSNKGQKVWHMVLAIASLMIVLTQGYVIFELLLSTQYSIVNTINYSVNSHILLCSLGMLSLLLFNVLLGLKKLNLVNYLVREFFILLLFIFATLVLTTLHFHIINNSIKSFGFDFASQSIYIILIPFAAIVITAYRYKTKLYSGLLITYALANMVLIEASVFPYVFPGHMSYQQASSSTKSLEVVTILSIIFLPILFISLYFIKRLFNNLDDDISY